MILDFAQTTVDLACAHFFFSSRYNPLISFSYCCSFVAVFLKQLLPQHGSRMIPNGFVMLAPTLLSIGALICSIIAAIQCSFVKVQLAGYYSRAYEGQPTESTPVSTKYIGFGLFQHEDISDVDSDSCTGWNGRAQDLFYDNIMKLSAAMSVIAAFFGIIVTIVLLFTWCVKFNKCGIIGLGISVIFTGLLQGVTMTVFASDLCLSTYYKSISNPNNPPENPDDPVYWWASFYMDCELARGGIISVVACACWIIAGCIICIAACTCMKGRLAEEDRVKEKVAAGKQVDDEEEENAKKYEPGHVADDDEEAQVHEGDVHPQEEDVELRNAVPETDDVVADVSTSKKD